MPYRCLTGGKRTRESVIIMELVIPLVVFLAVLAFVAWKTPSASRR